MSEHKKNDSNNCMQRHNQTTAQIITTRLVVSSLSPQHFNSTQQEPNAILSMDHHRQQSNNCDYSAQLK